MKIVVCISMLIGLLGSSAYATGSWSLVGDWNANLSHANPNGAWSYGQVVGGVFSTQPWSSVVADNTPGYFGVPGNYAAGAFVYQNTASWANYGVNPGQISLESDWGSAAVRWTAPSTGDYDIAVAIGGTTAIEAGPQGVDYGFGNNFAYNAGLNINGNTTAGSFSGNVMSWDIDDVLLHAGQSVTAYVINPGYADGGNTQTTFTVTSVPEPTTMIAGALLLLPFGASTLRILRRKCVA